MSATSTKMDELIASIKACDVEKVIVLVEGGIDLEKPDPEYKGNAPLLIAAKLRKELKEKSDLEKNHKIIKILLDAKANINQRDGYGNPLLILIRDDDLDLCSELIARGANINAYSDKKYFPPLMCAIRKGKYHLALLLIEKGADVNFLGSDYASPHEQRNALIELVLNCSIYFFSENIVPQLKILKALLNAQANPNQQAYNGQHVLFHVFEMTKSEPRNQLLHILLKHNANVLQKDNYNKTPLDMAFKYGLSSSISIILDKLQVTPNNVKELFNLFATFGYVEGLQKIYNSGLDISFLLFETYGKLGELVNGFFKTVFGHNSVYFYPDRETCDPIMITVRWFLKYMTTDQISENIKSRRVKLTDHLDLNGLPRDAQELLQLNSRILSSIISVMIQELIKRNETEFCSVPERNQRLLFLHPSVSLKEISEFLSKSMDCSKEEASKLIHRSRKEISQRKSGLMPYWTLAQRNNTGFKFCQLNHNLKIKIMEFLDVPPLNPAMLSSYRGLLTKRLNWAQDQVTERERLRTADKK